MILRIRKRQWMSRCGRWQGEQVPECLCNKRQYKVFWREDIADDTRGLIEKTISRPHEVGARTRPRPPERQLKDAGEMVSRVGLEPTTIRLKVECSTS
jgi:hypothetical protein|tara:strand:- start:15851 stop:16144 length:294 start_codon:yes stop_codon:yes gene_type:complete